MSDTEAGAGIDIEAFHRGDPEAFRVLLESHGHLIRSITASYAGDGDERDDLYQEVCVRIWKQRHRYEHRGSLSGWIAKLTHYHARNGAPGSWHGHRRWIGTRFRPPPCRTQGNSSPTRGGC